MGILPIIIILAIIVLLVASLWKVFEKAGKPGWAAIVPIYGNIVMAEVARKPWYWGLLSLLPYIGWVWGIMIAYNIAKNFGKGTGFTVGLVLLPIIFYPILGFGDAQYITAEKVIVESDTLDQGVA